MIDALLRESRRRLANTAVSRLIAVPLPGPSGEHRGDRVGRAVSLRIHSPFSQSSFSGSKPGRRVCHPIEVERGDQLVGVEHLVAVVAGAHPSNAM